MANTGIIVTFTDAVANSVDSYEHTMSEANLDRIVAWMRAVYYNPETDGGGQISKNQGRKRAVKTVVQNWKTLAKNLEMETVAKDAAANVAPIDSTEV